MGPYSDNMKLQAAAQLAGQAGQDSGRQAVAGVSERGAIYSGRGLSLPQTTRDAPVWDQMRARVGGKMEGLQQVLATLQCSLSPVLEVTGKNTPAPVGYGQTEPPVAMLHDSAVIEFMRQLEMNIDNAREQVEFMIRRLPFDSAPF